MAESERHPCLQGLSKHRGAPPTVVVIFGASGDLTARKLIPAIYNLSYDNLLPADFHLVGYGRKPIPDEEFRTMASGAVKEFSRRELDAEIWGRVAANTTYVSGGYDERAGFDRLPAPFSANPNGTGGRGAGGRQHDVRLRRIRREGRLRPACRPYRRDRKGHRRRGAVAVLHLDPALRVRADHRKPWP